MTEERVLKVYSPDDLPNGMVGLKTSKGQTLKNEAFVVNGFIKKFANQVNPTYCGPASLALLMNALNLGYHIKFQSVTRNTQEEEQLIEKIHNGDIKITEDEVLNAPRAAVFVKTLDVEKNGMTLSDLASLTMYAGLGVNKYFAYPNGLNMSELKKNELSQQKENNGDVYTFHSSEEFREFAKDYIKRPVTGLIVNYDMAKLGYTELLWGHFSSLAGYHEQTDMFLIMDVWPDTPSAWVYSEDLFKAMSTVDSDTGLPRGLLHIHELL